MSLILCCAHAVDLRQLFPNCDSQISLENMYHNYRFLCHYIIFRLIHKQIYSTSHIYIVCTV